MILDWPCKWDGCLDRLNEKNHNKNRKYCDLHQKENTKLKRKAINKKYSLRKSQEKKVCTVCKKRLGGSHRKFCSVKCSDKFFMAKKKQQKIKKSIEFHSRKIQELIRKL
jgi:hypothetical protein